MFITNDHPDNFSDNQRKITSINQIKRLFEQCIYAGNMIEQMANPANRDDINIVPFSYEKFMHESWVFSVYRLLKWLEAYRRAYGLPKKSRIRELTKHLKKVRELRDYLMHDEEYVVASEGKKPKRYLSMSEEKFSILSPSSTVVFHNSSINGKPMDRVLNLGNKIEFYSLHNAIFEAYKFAKKENFFDVTKLVKTEEEHYDQD